MKINTAAILVGGRGTRLGSLVSDRAKPLALIDGKPFLDHLLVQLSLSGIQEVVLLTGHRNEDFQDYPKRSKEFNLNISISAESEPLGSGGAVKLARNFLQGHGGFALFNGDTFLEADLKKFLHALPSDVVGCLGLMSVKKSDRYGHVEIDSKGIIKSFSEKSWLEEGLAYAGCALFSDQLFDFFPANQKSFSLEMDVLPKIKNLSAVTLKGKFFDIGLPESFAEFNADLVLRNARSNSESLCQALVSLLQGGRLYLSKNLFAKYGDSLSKEIPILEASEKTLVQMTTKDLLLLPEGQDAVCMAKVFSIRDAKLPAWMEELQVRTKRLELSFGQFSLQGAAWRPALFLDRDGVVIEFVDYIKSAQDVKLKPGIVDLIKQARLKDWAVVVITNQSGIGREYFDWVDYDLVNARMQTLLANNGAYIDRILVSPYFADTQRAIGHHGFQLRKPKPGMIQEAAAELRIQVEKSVLIGDSASDLQAGITARVGKLFHLFSAREKEDLSEFKKYSQIKFVEHLVQIKELL